MNKKNLKKFIFEIPKADLHCHLDGSARLKTLIELAKKEKVKLPSYTENGLKKLVFKDKYKNLAEYLKGFPLVTSVLCNKENLERAAYETAADAINENVHYLEVRFAPQLHTSKKLTTAESIYAVIAGLQKAQKEHNLKKDILPFHFGVIVCAMRKFSAQMSPYFADFTHAMKYSKEREIYAYASLELAKTIVYLTEEKGLKHIAGFDLAGEEAGYPAIDHWRSYQFVHKHFIKKTVHAGEAYGPESIFQAVTECHANRIGHGTFLFAHQMIKDPEIKNKKQYTEKLAEYLASQRIGIEVCPTSNLQTIPSLKTIKHHPVKKMIDHGLAVTICTDNRLVSNTTMTKELNLVTEAFNLPKQTLRNLVIAGFKGSFFSGPYRQKRTFIKQVIARFKHLEEKYR